MHPYFLKKGAREKKRHRKSRSTRKWTERANDPSELLPPHSDTDVCISTTDYQAKGAQYPNQILNDTSILITTKTSTTGVSRVEEQGKAGR
jgi:hypothetical protein